MTAKAWTITESLNERQFIRWIDPLHPGKIFNDSPECFAEYCNMQANHAWVSGFPLLAGDMLQARDIAWPDFRSKKRKLGWAITGIYARPPKS